MTEICTKYHKDETKTWQKKLAKIAMASSLKRYENSAPHSTSAFATMTTKCIIYKFHAEFILNFCWLFLN